MCHWNLAKLLTSIVCIIVTVVKLTNCTNSIFNFIIFSASQVPDLVSKMVGQKLVTKQTPADGVLVKKVMVAEALDIERETYLAILMDRAYNGPVIVGSSQGGVDIEEVAHNNPEAIFKV